MVNQNIFRGKKWKTKDCALNLRYKKLDTQ